MAEPYAVPRLDPSTHALTPEGRPVEEDRAMTKFERRSFFERLLAMRAAYRATGHRASTMTIEDAIAYAECLMIDEAELESALAADDRDVEADPSVAGCSRVASADRREDQRHL
jgi:hypothetical protein